MKFTNKITKKLLKVIPGGAHTYSRGADTFPSNAPAILDRGKGVYIYDEKNNKYLDYGMGLRSVNIGYAENSINNSAIEAIRKGNNLTRPSLIELKAAELFVSLMFCSLLTIQEGAKQWLLPLCLDQLPTKACPLFSSLWLFL